MIRINFFYGGAVMGLAVVGFSLFGVAAILLLFGNTTISLDFSFGASSLALFAKAGGGIFTKTADVSADRTGKVELGIPEDDPRNPAVIADNVGDTVGDPFKDTAGPSINTQITVVSLAASSSKRRVWVFAGKNFLLKKKVLPRAPSQRKPTGPAACSRAGLFFWALELLRLSGGRKVTKGMLEGWMKCLDRD